MTDLHNKPDTDKALPQARIKRVKWSLSVAWVVPIIAALIAAYLVYDSVQDLGPKITIKFKDASGLKPGQTTIQYRGVRIGQVKTIDISDDLKDVLVQVRLERSAASIAREGSTFWIVRLGGGIENLTGLRTVISGPHIEVSPGTGEPKKEFVGRESSPVAASEVPGLKIILVTNNLGSLKPNSPVYYRGVEVGLVQDVQLGANANTVHVHVVIRQRYEKLVRGSSKFWDVSGADIKFGLFRGLEINVQSLRSMLAGGVAFATAYDGNAKPVKNGTLFRLHEEPKKEWLQWAPPIALPPES